MDVRKRIDQSQSQATTIFIDSDGVQYWIKRFTVILEQHGHRIFTTNNMYIKHVFFSIFVDSISNNVIHQFFAAEVDLEDGGRADVARLEEADDGVERMLYVLVTVSDGEVQRPVVAGPGYKGHHLDIGMATADDDGGHHMGEDDEERGGGEAPPEPLWPETCEEPDEEHHGCHLYDAHGDAECPVSEYLIEETVDDGGSIGDEQE